MWSSAPVSPLTVDILDDVVNERREKVGIKDGGGIKEMRSKTIAVQEESVRLDSRELLDC